MAATVAERRSQAGLREAFDRNAGAREWKRRGTRSGAYRPRLNEWVADFALAGKSALDGPDWASRMVLFRLHYLGLAPYEKARHFLGLSEPSWVNWTEQIRHRCGRELLSRGMFLPRKYFTNGHEEGSEKFDLQEKARLLLRN